MREYRVIQEERSICVNTGRLRRKVNMCEYTVIKEERSLCVNTE
jgi:hypothetical protein